MEAKQKLEISKTLFKDLSFTPKACWSTWGAPDVYVRHVPYKNTHGVHVGRAFLYRSVFNVLGFVYLVLCNEWRVLGSGIWKSGQTFDYRAHTVIWISIVSTVPHFLEIDCTKRMMPHVCIVGSGFQQMHQDLWSTDTLDALHDTDTLHAWVFCTIKRSGFRE